MVWACGWGTLLREAQPDNPDLGMGQRGSPLVDQGMGVPVDLGDREQRAGLVVDHQMQGSHRLVEGGSFHPGAYREGYETHRTLEENPTWTCCLVREGRERKQYRVLIVQRTQRPFNAV